MRINIILLAFFLLVQLLPTPAFAQNREQVTIGLIFPLTGPMSSFGSDIAVAAPLLEEKFNSQQDRFHFTLKLEDGMFGHSNAAITAAKKLKDIDGAQFLVTGSSGETLQVAPFAEQHKLLTVAGFSSHPAIKNSGDYIFRTYIDADRGIHILADKVKSTGIKSMVLISEESSFTDAISQSLRNHLGNIIKSEEIFKLGEADFRSIIVRLRSHNPDAYYLNTVTPASFINIYQQLQSVDPDKTFYTYYVPSLKEVQNSLGESLKGSIYLDFPENLASSLFYREFLADFTKKTGSKLTSEFNFRTNFNAIKVIFDGIMSAGNNTEAVKNYLYRYDAESATGRLRFDSNGDAVDLNLVLKTY